MHTRHEANTHRRAKVLLILILLAFCLMAVRVVILSMQSPLEVLDSHTELLEDAVNELPD